MSAGEIFIKSLFLVDAASYRVRKGHGILDNLEVQPPSQDYSTTCAHAHDVIQLLTT